MNLWISFQGQLSQESYLVTLSNMRCNNKALAKRDITSNSPC